MRKSNWCGLALAAGLALASAGGARAALIDVQFGETDDGIFGPTPHYTGAAVRGGAGDLWNFVGGSFNPDYLNPNATGWGRSITDQPLFDSTGAATGVTLSLTTPDAFIRLDVFAPVFKGTPYAALMDSFVFADGDRLAGQVSDGPGFVTLEGLLPNHAYELILLSAGDVVGRQTTFTLDGTTQVAAPSGIASFVEGDTYARFLALSDATGTLAFSFAAGNGLEGNLNALQLLDVPAPGGLPLLLAAALGVAWRRRRLVLVATAIAMAAPTVQAATLFYGLDLGPANGTHANSDAARAAFLAVLPAGAAVGVETFDTLTPQALSTQPGDSLTLSFPALTITGKLTKPLFSDVAVTDQQGFAFATILDRFPISGRNYLDTFAAGARDYFTLELSAPAIAFGFYATSVSDYEGIGSGFIPPVKLTLDGGPRIDVVDVDPLTITQGSVHFFGIIADAPFTEVRLINPLGAVIDDTGFDDLTIVAADVPEPGGLALLALAMAGLSAARRRQAG